MSVGALRAMGGVRCKKRERAGAGESQPKEIRAIS
jgi:hypothetical protein